MPWESKEVKMLDKIYNNDDTLKQTWSISRRVNEAENKKYARELCRTVHYTKDGQAKSFPITLTMADFNWILANKDLIKAGLAPTPKAAAPAPAAAQTVGESDSIDDVPF